MMKKTLILLMITASTLLASIGKVTALKGEASLLRAGKTMPIMIGSKLEEHDALFTAKKSKLQIVFNDKTVISLGQKSTLKVDEYIFSEKKVAARFSIGKGFFKSITGRIGKISPKQFKIKTANATIGVRGTTIIGEVSQKRDIIACSYGQIEVSTSRGSMLVNAGERTIVEETKAPRQAEKVNSVILKLLDHKSDPSVAEAPAPSEVAIKPERVKKENSVNEKKSSEKFEPWVEEKEKRSLADIETIVGERKPTYSGQIVEGTTANGAIDKESSAVRLGFDLGTGKMDGDMKFKDAVSDYAIKVDGKLQGDGHFDFNANNGYDGGGSGTLSGEKLEHANGDIHFVEKQLDGSSNAINAKFETTHQK